MVECTLLWFILSSLFLDINECLDHLASCNQICNNTDGSYTCDCFTGYELKDNNRTCIGGCGRWVWFGMVARWSRRWMGVVGYMLIIMSSL